MTNEEIADRLFKRFEAMIGKALEPLAERLAALEETDIPTAADVARSIMSGEEIGTLVDLHVAEAVKSIEPIKGEKGDPGKDGRDGLDLKDMFRAEGGHLIAVLSDGTTKDLGQFVGKDGRDGTNGKDGAGLTELVRSYDADNHEIVEKWGEKELRYPAGGIRPGGYWREGTKAVAAQVWNHAGVAWIAKRDTSTKPTRESEDWEIFANKGRDGLNGQDGKAPPQPVKLGASNG